MNLVVVGKDVSCRLQLSGLVRQAKRLNLKIHTYTLRVDWLSAYVASFEELLQIFFNEAKVDKVIIDLSDSAMEWLQNKPPRLNGGMAIII